MARQENVWLPLEEIRLDHLMIEAAGRVMKVLVSEQMYVNTVLGGVHLGNLHGKDMVSVEGYKEINRERGMRDEEDVTTGGFVR